AAVDDPHVPSVDVRPVADHDPVADALLELHRLEPLATADRLDRRPDGGDVDPLLFGPAPAVVDGDETLNGDPVAQPSDHPIHPCARAWSRSTPAANGTSWYCLWLIASGWSHHPPISISIAVRIFCGTLSGVSP